MTAKTTDTTVTEQPAPAAPTTETTLYAPDGRSWTASTPEEVTNLKARGYSETKPKK